MGVDIFTHQTKQDLPKEVREFFLNMKHEHLKQMGVSVFIESFNLRIDIHLLTATLETVASTYDRDKNWWDFIDEPTE